MSSERLEGTLARLQREFDEGFVRAHVAELPDLIDLLEVRVAAQPYALRLQQVAAVHADRRLVRAPSPRSDLLGLANLGGTIAPIYDLAQLLGHGPRPDARWLARVRGDAPFGVAFDRFERHLRVIPAAITSVGAFAKHAHGPISGSVRTDSGPLPLIDLLALQQAVTSSDGDVPTLQPKGTP